MSHNPWVQSLRVYNNSLNKNCPNELKVRMLELLHEIQNSSAPKHEVIAAAAEDIQALYERVKQEQPKQLFAGFGISGKEIVAQHLLHQQKEAFCRDTLAFLEKLKKLNPLPGPIARHGKISLLFDELGSNASEQGTPEPIERLSSPRFGKSSR